MELGKPSALSVTAWVALIAIVIYLIFVATHKEDNQNYTKGAVHNQSSLTIAPVEHNYPLALPRCGRLFSVDPAWAKQFDKPEATKGKK